MLVCTHARARAHLRTQGPTAVHAPRPSSECEGGGRSPGWERLAFCPVASCRHTWHVSCFSADKGSLPCAEGGERCLLGRRAKEQGCRHAASGAPASPCRMDTRLCGEPWAVPASWPDLPSSPTLQSPARAGTRGLEHPRNRDQQHQHCLGTVRFMGSLHPGSVLSHRLCYKKSPLCLKKLRHRD